MHRGSIIHAHFFGNLQAEGCACHAAPTCLAQGDVHLVANVAHGQNHLVRRHGGANARQRHIRAAHGNHGACGVSLHAGHLHKAGDGVAHQAQQALDGHGRRVAHGRHIAAAQVAQGACGHGAGRTDFVLA
ncbi:MAG TPA: hypothetical protein VIK21_01240, partial [Desulfuromonadaceae bacterium]